MDKHCSKASSTVCTKLLVARRKTGLIHSRKKEAPSCINQGPQAFLVKDMRSMTAAAGGESLMWGPSSRMAQTPQKGGPTPSRALTAEL